MVLRTSVIRRREGQTCSAELDPTAVVHVAGAGSMAPLGAGMASRAVAVLATSPIELVRTRLSGTRKTAGPSYSAQFKTVLKQLQAEGQVRNVSS